MYDLAVIGLGAIGSATAYFAAKSGASVLGIERFEAIHDQGSSHGETRIIRKAYFESPAYVRLAVRAYDAWRDIEKQSGKRLMHLTGGLMIGHPDSEVYRGSLLSARTHGLKHEALRSTEIQERFPVFQLPDDYRALFEPETGVLRVEKCVAAFQSLALAADADLRFSTPVRRWQESPSGGFILSTDNGDFTCKRLVFCAGAWSGQLLGNDAPPMQVERLVQHWFRPLEDAAFEPGRFPIYIVDTLKTSFYGIPTMGPSEGGVKHAFHSVRQPQSIENIDRSISNERDIKPLRDHLAQFLPLANGDHLHAKTCLYTTTPDHHFVIGPHPVRRSAWIACGFSGHGFKFAPVIGKSLSEWALTGQYDGSLGLFNPRRFQDTFDA